MLENPSCKVKSATGDRARSRFRKEICDKGNECLYGASILHTKVWRKWGKKRDDATCGNLWVWGRWARQEALENLLGLLDLWSRRRCLGVRKCLAMD